MLVGILPAAVSRFLRTGGTQQAAGIAFRVHFAMAPLAIVLVAVMGLVLQNDGARESATDLVIDALPVDESARDTVETPSRASPRLQARPVSSALSCSCGRHPE